MMEMSKAEVIGMARKNVVLEHSDDRFRVIYNGFAYPWIESKGDRHSAWVLTTVRIHYICWRLGLDVPSFVIKSRGDVYLYDMVDRLWNSAGLAEQQTSKEVER